ncbi:MAG: DUF4956 domain-containing protein [Acidimicrobiales bacterium]
MSRSVLILIDFVAIGLLVFGLYFPRHRRKDMLVAYMGVNIGVLALTVALSSTSVGSGLGLGLFGVLSIIRLRSDTLDQVEVAYYFAALALGLLSGIDVSPSWLAPSLIVAIVVALLIADHPRLYARYRVQIVNLDVAVTSEAELRQRLEDLLGARVHRVKVRRVDLVSDTTLAEVRYQVIEENPSTQFKPIMPIFEQL